MPSDQLLQAMIALKETSIKSLKKCQVLKAQDRLTATPLQPFLCSLHCFLAISCKYLSPPVNNQLTNFQPAADIIDIDNIKNTITHAFLLGKV